MTALSARTAARTEVAIAKLGAAGSLVIMNDTYATGGVVTGTPVTVAVVLVGPVDESKRYMATGAATGTTATFYLAAKGLTVEPSTGDEIVYGSRTFKILSVTVFEVQEQLLAWQLDVMEIGNA